MEAWAIVEKSWMSEGDLRSRGVGRECECQLAERMPTHMIGCKAYEMKNLLVHHDSCRYTITHVSTSRSQTIMSAFDKSCPNWGAGARGKNAVGAHPKACATEGTKPTSLPHSIGRRNKNPLAVMQIIGCPSKKEHWPAKRVRSTYSNDVTRVVQKPAHTDAPDVINRSSHQLKNPHFLTFQLSQSPLFFHETAAPGAANLRVPTHVRSLTQRCVPTAPRGLHSEINLLVASAELQHSGLQQNTCMLYFTSFCMRLRRSRFALRICT